LAVRVPDHGIAQQLLEAVGIPLATTSANHSGKPALVKGSDVVRQFKNKVDVIVDGGACGKGKESSVVDVTHFPFSILRKGAIPKEQLERVLGLN
jgi:L-threonylcarbamoyladenylate synthase